MRKSSLMLALYSLAFATPGRADLLPYTLSGTIVGTQTTVVCVLDPNDPACLVNTPFTHPFAFTLTLDLEPGLNEFQTGSPYSSFGAFSGTILSENGELSGLNMIFGQSSCGPGIPGIGCFTRFGTAPTFVVQQGAGVPEPATWLFMLLGFGYVGLRLRVPRRKRLAPQLTRLFCDNTNVRNGSKADISGLPRL